MKYCPYCGAELLEGAVSFCSECGKEIPRRKSGNQSVSTSPPKSEKNSSPTNKQAFVSDPEIVDDGYDGYYDSILPVDDGQQHERLDKTLVKRITVIFAALVVVIIAYVILMLFL